VTQHIQLLDALLSIGPRKNNNIKQEFYKYSAQILGNPWLGCAGWLGLLTERERAPIKTAETTLQKPAVWLRKVVEGMR
jgi:hypothetical protein